MKFEEKKEGHLPLVKSEDNPKNEYRKIGSFTDADSGLLINDCLYKAVYKKL